MNDIDMSSCSFITECEDGLTQLQREQNKTSELTIQIQHKQDVIQHLQASVDSLKLQLKEALDAVSATKNTTDQIQLLKDELSEAAEREKSLNREIKRIRSDTEAQFIEHQNEVIEVSKARDDLAQKLQVSQEHIQKLRKDRQLLIDDLETKDQAMETIVTEIQELKLQKKKLRNKTVAIAERLQDAEGRVVQLDNLIDTLENDKSAICQEVETLKTQLSTCRSIITESENTIVSLKNELSVRASCIDALEKEFEAQKNEIEQYGIDRQNIITLLQKAHTGLTITESKIETVTKENENLRNRLKGAKKSGARQSGISQPDISDLSLPFEGAFGDKIRSIFALPQYQPMQRLQLIMTECAKHINILTEKCDTLTKQNHKLSAQVEEQKSGQVQYGQILAALLRDLKNICGIEHDYILPSVNSEEEDQFKAFVIEKTTQIDPFVRDDIIAESQFVPSDIFFTIDMNKRKNAVKELLHPTEIGFSILTAQFLTNVILRRRLDSLNEPLKKIIEISHPTSETPPDIAGIPAYFKKIIDSNDKLKQSRKQIRAAFKKAQNTQIALARADSDQKTRISQLELQNESLTNEVEVLKVKYQVVSNELALKTNECSSLADFAAHIKENVVDQQNETRIRTDRLEAALQEKTKECNTLTSLVRKLQNSIDEITNEQTRKVRHNEGILKQSIVDLQEENEQLERKLQQKKKDAKRMEKALKEQYDASMREAIAGFEASKASFEETIQEMKDKAKHAHEMSRKLVESVNDSERRNQRLIEENSRLSHECKNINVQIATLRQQVAKEKQHVQAQLAAQMMACESKVQAATMEVKSGYEKQIRDLLEYVCENIGHYYDIDENDFNEESLRKVVSHVKDDLDKLAFFQTESTRYNA